MMVEMQRNLDAAMGIRSPVASVPVTEKWAEKLAAAVSSRPRGYGSRNDVTVLLLLSMWEKQEGRCYWFGIPLIAYPESSWHPQQPSIDRIDNAKGYTADNIVLCCLAANLGRGATSFEAFEEFVALVKRTPSIVRKK